MGTVSSQVKAYNRFGHPPRPDLVLVRVSSFGSDWVFDPFEGCVTVPLVFNSIRDGKLASDCGAFRADADVV